MSAPQQGTTSAFAVSCTTLGGATVFSPSGSLTHETCEEFRKAVQQAGEAVSMTVVIDCRRVPAMDSAGIELLTALHVALHQKGGCLKLCNLNDVCSDIMFVTRLTHVLDIFGDIKQAVQFGGGA